MPGHQSGERHGRKRIVHELTRVNRLNNRDRIPQAPSVQNSQTVLWPQLFLGASEGSDYNPIQLNRANLLENFWGL